uniref:Uncharacterized protein n=1 Tax=Anguilla anguilla TaxID=7936 RepID=A0A0E9VPK2_ANGAN
MVILFYFIFFKYCLYIFDFDIFLTNRILRIFHYIQKCKIYYDQTRVSKEV